jgi:toxin ParE1/3/4
MPAAQEDIREIVDYIVSQSPPNTARVVRKLYDQFERLAQFPGIGHTRRELRDDTPRVVAVFSFLVIYDPRPRPLEILRVVRGARQLQWIKPR